ncbi:MAG: DUF1553 domain-containing protein [Planctomycetota bacterium]
MHRHHYFLILVATLAPALAASEPSADDLAFFNQKVQPILQNRCFECHAGTKAKGSLLLDSESARKSGGESGALFVPGKPDESLLIKAVRYTDKDLTMPPEKKGKLPDAEIAILIDWITRGAPSPHDAPAQDMTLLPGVKTHWSFQPLIKPAVPKTPDANPIDSFITSALESKGLKRSPPADARTLVRRMYFDLIGLPPTPEQIADFEIAHAASREKAIATLVDSLLASPHYGERWARHWLDVVRFAESDGFETNQPRPNAWRYRDYVIDAFNSDKPYDRFVREQLAGDALGADEATGFIVGGPWDRVKSPDPVLTANQRADELHDMVGTTGSAFLGLSVNCARCHNHKFDPITQVDYYSMVACFAGVAHGERALRPTDFDEREKKNAAIRAQIAPLDARLAKLEPVSFTRHTLLLDDDTPEAKASNAPAVEILIPRIGLELERDGTARGQLKDPGDTTRLPNLGRNYSYWKNVTGKDVFAWLPHLTGRYRIWLSWGCGHKTHAEDARYILDLDGNLETKNDQTEIARVNQQKFADGTGNTPNQPLWSGFFDAGIRDLRPESKIILRGGSTDAYISADLLFFQEEGPSAVQLRSAVTRGKNVDKFTPVEAAYVRFNITETSQLEPCIDELEIFTAGPEPLNVALATTGAKATASGTYKNNPLHKLEHINDGAYGNARSWISNTFGKGWVQIQLAKPERIDRVVWSRDRENVPRYDDRLATRYTIDVSMDGTTWQTVSSSDDRLPYSRYKGVVVRTLTGSTDQERKDIAEVAAAKAVLEKQLATASALPMAYAGKFSQPGPTYRMHRGDPTQHKEDVSPAVLTHFGSKSSLPANTPEKKRRLALADWIVAPDNPLTPRVMVNRLWHYHFGTGLADTPSDLGLNGGRPSHRELIDFLADDFKSRGWSIKAMQRLICTSETYLQSSAPQPNAIAVDGSNRLLWRYPPRRLEAESLRDTILAVSGSLNPKMGGPGFDLFDPNTNYVKVYATKTKFTPDDFRRMVYQSKPRAELDTLFGAFDCPDAGQIQPKRTVSTTPLQALNLLNSSFMLDQSRAFAERLERDAPGNKVAQIRRAFQLAFGRDASSDELSASEKLVTTHGMAAFCRALFNANEFMMLL